MASLNPFLHDDDDEDFSNSSTTLSAKTIPVEVSLDDIAESLIKNKYVLTALELYTEIQEKGKDLPRLRNYFSNPSNFDLPVVFKDAFCSGGLSRTASCSTFDSLDMARLSDEGGQVDEKVAVLEFELRKAKETIKSLRANLTETAESLPSCLQESLPNGVESNQSMDNPGCFPIKPLELRALNHLVNEHLLNHGYKLSSITFADENAEQDFEDWDDVGINTAKPPDLLRLYRDYNNHAAPQLHTCDAFTMTSCMEECNGEDSEQLKKYQDQVLALEEENLNLKSEIDELQRELDRKKNAIEKSQHRSPDVPMESSTQSQVAYTETVLEDPGNDEIPVDDSSDCEPRRMPKVLWEAMLLEMQSELEESWLKTEVLNVAESPDDVVQLLGLCLPHIVPTVLLAKRDQLVPLLLSTAALHPDPGVRNELLRILFNLIKKPDPRQRQIILHGCTSYARHVGRHRTEEELLPQFWEQIGHKFPERRQLVAEACGAISPYLRAEMRGSLLISILLQMEQEEKVDAVRCSLVKSFSSIFTFVDDDDKYTQAFQCLSSFLDESGSIRHAACLHLLPPVAMWSIRRHSIHSQMCEELLSKLERAVNEKKTDSAITELLSIVYLLPYLFVAALLEINSDLKDEEELPAARTLPDVRRKLEDPAAIIGDKSLLDEKLRFLDLMMISSKSNINNEAKVLLWTTNFLLDLPRMLNILASIDPEFIEGVTSLAELMDLFCMLFGNRYIKEKVLLLFENVFKNSTEHLSTCILPVYVASILTCLKDNRTLIHDFLLDSIVKLSIAQFSTENVKLALLLLRCKHHYHDVIIQVLWSAVMNELSLVRSTAASLLVVMTTNDVDPKVLSTRILPALFTLSTDDRANVRIATVPSFFYVMTNPTVDVDLVDRVITQLAEVAASDVESSHEEHPQDGTLLGLFSVRSTLLHLVAKIGAVLHPKFRDDFVLPHLVTIATSNNQCADTSKRSLISLALFDAYSCLSCCFITSSLLMGSVLPALKCLLCDTELLHPGKVDDVVSLINEVERKLERGSAPTDARPPLSQSTVSSPAFPRGGANQLGQVISSSASDTKRKLMNSFGHLKKRTPSGSSILSWKS